jgi:hypothetical protein
MLYSKSTGGFYTSEIHGDNMPADVVEITTEHHAALLDGQSNGKLIAFNEAGYPFLTDPPPPAPDTLEQVLAKRQAAYVAESDPLKNEAEYDAIIAGTEPDYTAWLAKCAEIKARLPLP